MVTCSLAERQDCTCQVSHVSVAMHCKRNVNLVIRIIADSAIRIVSFLRCPTVHPQARTGNTSALNLLRRVWSVKVLVVKASVIDQKFSHASVTLRLTGASPLPRISGMWRPRADRIPNRRGLREIETWPLKRCKRLTQTHQTEMQEHAVEYSADGLSGSSVNIDVLVMVEVGPARWTALGRSLVAPSLPTSQRCVASCQGAAWSLVLAINHYSCPGYMLLQPLGFPPRCWPSSCKYLPVFCRTDSMTRSMSLALLVVEVECQSRFY